MKNVRPFLRAPLAARIVLLAGAGLLAGGCTPPTVNSVDISSNGQNNWIVTDPKLRDIATFSNVSKTRADDLLQVQVDVRNITNYPHTFKYRFIWLDDRGQQVGASTLSVWQEQYISGQQTASLQGVAPNAQVTDARLEMIRAD